MSVPDRTDLTDCQDELHRMVREMNSASRRINDLEQQLFAHASTLHGYCTSDHSTFPYCDNSPCKDATSLLGITRTVQPR